jgi:hypothetical protein
MYGAELGSAADVVTALWHCLQAPSRVCCYTTVLLYVKIHQAYLESTSSKQLRGCFILNQT